MLKLVALIGLLGSLSGATAGHHMLNGRDGRVDLSNNLVYRSPSLHPKLEILGIPLDDVHERMDRERAKLRKRQGFLNPFANTSNSASDVYKGTLSFPYGVASGDPLNNSVVLWTLPVKTDAEVRAMTDTVCFG